MNRKVFTARRKNIFLFTPSGSLDSAVAKSDKIAAASASGAANMMMAATSGVTRLLNDWQDGDRSALEKLTPLIYEELRRIAHRYVQRERSADTLQTTALVNEAYVRLAGHKTPVWQSRSHFFAVTAQVMRHILIDHARRRRYLKHGGQLQQVSLEEASLMTEHRAAELMALDEALDELKQFDSRKSKVVELRYFGGLSLEETATTLGMSAMTVRRDWRAAKAWLFRRMRESDRSMECAEYDAIAHKSAIARQSHDS